jgi:hypothetical protein
MTDLDTLARLHGTDKSSLQHGYTAQYKRYFADLPAKGSLLELGWGGHEDPDKGGESARMWRDWLPRWQITIIDNEQKNTSARDRGIDLRFFDQTDEECAVNGPYDIIIDDASHLSSLTIKSFEVLWPHLKPGGWYVVEDTHMAYHDFFYGPDEASSDPARGGYDQNGLVDTAMGFLKRLADEANCRGRSEWDLFPPVYSLGYEVEEIHFHFNICFVKKRG